MTTPHEQTNTSDEKRPHPVEIVIDNAEIVAPAKVENERELLSLVGKTLTEAYLVLVKGKRDRESFKDRPDEPITLHKGMRFVTVPIGPTPVS
jgi:hypothetical protein